MSRETGTTQPARFLLIEDDIGDVMLYRHALDMVGEEYLLDILHDGASALDFVERNWVTCDEVWPCLVILDLHLPKFDGLTVLKALRQAPTFAHIKVAVITTSASPQDEMELVAYNVNLYRKKPRDLQEFVEVGKELFEICQTEQIGV